MTDTVTKTKKPTQAEVNAAILELLTRNKEQLDKIDDRLNSVKQPSMFVTVWAWSGKNKMAIACCLLFVYVLVTEVSKALPISVTQTKIEQKAASEVADIPLTERRAVANALRTAADRIANAPNDSVERNAADEDVRKSVAMQPSKEKWQRAFAGISQMVLAVNPLTYADNLKLAAKGIEK
jgi:hypothetical protein